MKAVVQRDRLLNIFAIWGMKKTPVIKCKHNNFPRFYPSARRFPYNYINWDTFAPEIPEIAVVRLLDKSVLGIKTPPKFTSGYFDRLSFERKLTSESSMENQERIHLSEPSISFSFNRETRAITSEWTFYRESIANTFKWTFCRESRQNTFNLHKYPNKIFQDDTDVLARTK